LLIEPTETEAKQDLDDFITAMVSILSEAEETPEMVKSAPHTLPCRRLDDVRAVKELDIVWKEG
jgi:glycine dehydrogenase subunit 2